MKRARSPTLRHRPSAQRGLSLIELMIALVLGLIVVAAVYNTYTGSMRSERFTRGLQSVQENARHGIAALRRGLRLAGYSPEGGLDALDIAGAGPDRVVARLTQAYDCNGRATDAGGIAVNTYAFDAAGERITCTGSSAAASAMPIVEDVEAFRVLYGLDGDADCVPERFVPWAATLDVEDVVALRFAMLLSSGEAVRSRSRAETHVVLDTEIATDDRRVRAVFGTTVKLRNAARFGGRDCAGA